MADITISDLELAPALADDMVLAVENTTDTYAATLAMLRRLINKTFVEVENADFNALTDDGFYQCTGTPTNSPVEGAINWTLQVSAESGVVVQRAFSLDDNFANLYIRRWNGVTWTGWLEVGAGALANKADIDASNFNAAGKSLLSGLGMPSSRYIDLTLGASGTSYTAPANGWFRLVKKSTSVGRTIQFNPVELYRGIENSDAWMYQYSSIANQVLTITLPVLKGQKTWCYYGADGDTLVFEFIYAEGEN